MMKHEKRGCNYMTAKDTALLAAIIAVFVIAGYAEASFAAESERTPEEPEAIVETVTYLDCIDEPLVVEESSAGEPVYIYNVPLDADLQLYIIETCSEYHVEPSVIVAMIERESTFRADAIGDSGNSFGLMQIQRRWHEERMERLGVTDLLDPRQNVLVGIDYLAELCNRYECIGMALMAYNAGPTGAKTNWWDKGIFENAYSSGVLERSETLTEGMIEYVD